MDSFLNFKHYIGLATIRDKVRIKQMGPIFSPKCLYKLLKFADYIMVHDDQFMIFISSNHKLNEFSGYYKIKIKTCSRIFK